MADASPAPRFEGEDVRPTSVKEIRGWYFYGWAAEVFIVCGIGSFIPITIEQLARENGVLLEDRSKSCSAAPKLELPPDFNVTSTIMTPAELIAAEAKANQCIINFLGLEINTSSFAMYTFSISVLLQALLIISVSAAADHGQYRKKFLLTFAFTGAFATMLFLPVSAKVFYIAALLAIIANTCVGSSFVLLNSFLPLLVRRHPEVTKSKLSNLPPSVEASDDVSVSGDTQYDHDSIDSSTGLLQGQGDAPDATKPDPKSKAAPSPELQLSTRISSTGMGIGYIAAAIVQILAVLIVVMTGGTTFSLRLVLFVVGAWWAIFTIPTALWLRPRPGPPLYMGPNKPTHLGYILYAWRSLGRTIIRARKLKDVLIFLAAWFLLSDGIATISGTALLFAKTSLNMKPAALALINVVVVLSGVVGAFTWSRVSRMLGLRPSQTILACLCLFELIPVYALLGYLPPIKRLGNFGLQQPWEMYPLGAVYGIVLGGLSSYCRALFGELVPPGFEAAFFALYAITDKGSSVFGPAIVGLIIDATGDIRPAFWFLAVLIGLPAPLMYLVNVERGKTTGAALARELQRAAES